MGNEFKYMQNELNEDANVWVLENDKSCEMAERSH